MYHFDSTSTDAFFFNYNVQLQNGKEYKPLSVQMLQWLRWRPSIRRTPLYDSMHSMPGCVYVDLSLLMLLYCKIGEELVLVLLPWQSLSFFCISTNFQNLVSTSLSSMLYINYFGCKLLPVSTLVSVTIVFY